MQDRSDGNAGPTGNRTTIERASERELVVTRLFDAPARSLYAAWTRSDLFMQWWAPKSTGVPLLACEMDVRVGGGYRVAFGSDGAEPMVFFGKYIEVIPDARLVWTNEESEDAAVTTVTFEDKGDGTLVVLRERYPSKEALDAAIEGMEGCMPEQFEQLDALLVSLDADRLSDIGRR